MVLSFFLLQTSDSLVIPTSVLVFITHSLAMRGALFRSGRAIRSFDNTKNYIAQDFLRFGRSPDMHGYEDSIYDWRRMNIPPPDSA
uniref:ABC transmembrane type-1 domain-containing protein n=1 Tax=Heterorhabditis bacteriophora TaxID=37862 RepID=A0A1I7WUL2_HETBA